METKSIEISEPKFMTAEFTIEGTAPYMQNKFSQKAISCIRATHEAGQQSKSKKVRTARDFVSDCRGATYRTSDGKNGIPAPAFRNAMVSACRVAGVVMTKAKLSLFVEADGFDEEDGTPLVFFTDDTPEPIHDERFARNETGVVDIRARPLWREGWKAKVRIRWDNDQMSMESIANLLKRAGLQVGIGEGRNDSKKSCGIGFGSFDVIN